jgi:hypothetical protein
MGSSVDHERIAGKRAADGNEAKYARYLGAAALANRQYELAASVFGADTASRPTLTEPLRILALCKAGRAREAQAVARRFAAAYRRPLNYVCW